MEILLQSRRAMYGALGVLVAFAVVSVWTSPVQAADRSLLVAKAYASMGERKGKAPGREYKRAKGATSGVDRDVRRFCTAANKGDANAQFDLGYLYAVGRGVKRNEALAAAWFLKAAKQRHPQAQNWLKRLRVKPRRAECLLTSGRQVGGRRNLAAHPAKGPIADLIRDLAPEYRLSPDLVLAVVEAESNFNPRALSPKNAQGLMQLIPATAQRFGVGNVWDPEQNLRGGMAYLRWLLDHFDGDIRLALAGYNAGEQAVRRHQGIPPYDETRKYVSRISRRLNL